jgi:hypothetical protein
VEGVGGAGATGTDQHLERSVGPGLLDPEPLPEFPIGGLVRAITRLAKKAGSSGDFSIRLPLRSQRTSLPANVPQ